MRPKCIFKGYLHIPHTAKRGLLGRERMGLKYPGCEFEVLLLVDSLHGLSL